MSSKVVHSALLSMKGRMRTRMKVRIKIQIDANSFIHNKKYLTR